MSKSDAIAKTILDGFHKHYRLFREISADAKAHFERGNWIKAREDNQDRIRMYEQRVKEAVEIIEIQFPEISHDYGLWTEIKRSYIGLLLDHLQAECAETFYNSVACRVLHRRYYRNDYIFWRPALNTDNLEGSKETYHCYYPGTNGLRKCLLQILASARIEGRFAHLRRDVRNLQRALEEHRSPNWRPQSNFQFQFLGSMFFRNKAAYLVGRQVNGDQIQPMIIPLLKNKAGEIYVDTALTRHKDASILFSFTRAYFMADMEVPSAYISFLTSIMPTKSRVDLYAIMGLQKHAKTLFYREMQHHLNHSTDNFKIAPGIPGTVMLVFTLPSFPFVIKIIKDKFDPPKVTNRAQVKSCYSLVKFHDRIGRLADTLEYSNVGIPMDRIDPDLLAMLENSAGDSLERDEDRLVIKHCYIERRMIPLNEYLASADSKLARKVIDEYGKSIRELAAANIFPGDMMQKNFGVTRLNRVVFYDYDEICYMTDCRFRSIPDTGDAWEEMSAEPHYSLHDNDVFPETFGSFFFPNAELRKIFLRRHSDLVDPGFWKKTQETIRRGEQPDVFPYPKRLRFKKRFRQNRSTAKRGAAKRDAA